MTPHPYRDTRPLGQQPGSDQAFHVLVPTLHRDPRYIAALNCRVTGMERLRESPSLNRFRMTSVRRAAGGHGRQAGAAGRPTADGQVSTAGPGQRRIAVAQQPGHDELFQSPRCLCSHAGTPHQRGSSRCQTKKLEYRNDYWDMSCGHRPARSAPPEIVGRSPLLISHWQLQLLLLSHPQL
jgi:hypothetical protein